MTKNEFILKAMVQKFAMTNTADEFDRTDADNIARSSVLLAEAAECYASFDDDTDETKESMKTFVGQIASSLCGIESAVIEPNEKTNLSTFQEIVWQLNAIREKLTK